MPNALKNVLRRSRRRVGAEDGAVIIIVAVMLTAFLASAAMAIDLSASRQSQERAQVAADAGALAAADDLSTDAAAESTDATNVAELNDPGSTVAFSGANKTPSVSVSGGTANRFGAAIGSPSTRVSASATAGVGSGVDPGVIFAQDTSCSGTGIDFENNAADANGLPTVVDGASDANGSVTFSGNNNTWLDNATSTTINGTTIPPFSDAITYGNGCSVNAANDGSTDKIPSGQPTQRTSSITGWPVNYTGVASVSSTGQCGAGVVNLCTGAGCTVSYSSSTSFYGNNQPSPTFTGIVCIDGEATFFGYTSFSGDVTIVARGINVYNVSNITANAYYDNDLLFDCVSAPKDSGYPSGQVFVKSPGADQTSYNGYTCSLSANAFSGGTIFAPSNTIKVDNTTDVKITGYLEGQDVQVNGNQGLQLTGNGPVASGTAILTQ